ncbi:MAG TPA: sugar ABC transporter substrate-binding protein [Chloroflexota bacterium]|nr:sugar ABC transporter substrate-binding protein [Chloroflexota bacterium]
MPATRRRLIGGAIPTLLGTVACGPLRGAGDARPAGPLKPDVTIGFLQTSGQVELELVNQVVERWRQAHPRGPQAELIVATGDVVEKFSTMLAAGAPPALVSMDASQGVVFADRGEVAPLDDLIKRDRYDLGDYIPVSLEQYRWRDKLYALLRDFSHQSLWLNLDLFVAEGLSPPTGDYATSSGGWEFGQFVETARRLTKWQAGGGRATTYGFVLNTALRGGYGQFVWANGGELFDKEYRRCTVDDERAVEALQLMQDLRYRHRVAPDGTALQELRAAGLQTGSQQLFFENQVAMAIFPVARIGEARQQAKGAWDLAVAPHGAAGRGKRLTTGGGVGWYQVKAVPHQEEAWALLQHLTSAETHRLLADVRIPGRTSVLDWWLTQEPAQPPKSRSVARSGQQAVHLNPVFPRWNRIERDVFTPQLTRLWENQATAREVAREIVAQTNTILAEPGTAP